MYNRLFKHKILIAGIAGASLGTEIAKCLAITDRYVVYGSDISSFAYGHYSNYFQKTFLVDLHKYVESIINICLENKITYVIPGGEHPNSLLSKFKEVFIKNQINVVSNNQEVVSLCESKNDLFKFLDKNNILIPKNFYLNEEILFPCIIKPSKNSGGSNFVFIANNNQELENYVSLLLSNGLIPTIQEYIEHSDGEYTVGVLSSKRGEIIGAIALRKIFNSKLSIAFKSNDFLISSGYTQGLIDDFPLVIETCKSIAKLVCSTGPINIQGRLKNNKFIPFEINPRFSASTYLRTLAGFNEVDFYLRNIINEESEFLYQLKYGYYMRSFEEKYITKSEVLA